MRESLVGALIAALFLVVAGLLAYGAYAFRRSPKQASKVNMQLEVLWTGLAGALLLAIFVYVR